MLVSLLAALLAAVPALAEGPQSVRAVTLPQAVPSLALPAASAPALPTLPTTPAEISAIGRNLSLPVLPTALPAAAPQAARAPDIPALWRKSQGAPLLERLRGIAHGVQGAVEGVQHGSLDPRAAGEGVERLLTGERRLSGAGDIPVPAGPASGGTGADAGDSARARAEAAAQAVPRLAAAAEELLASRGLKASALTGPRFAAVVREAARAQDAAAPADAAGAAVRAAAARVVDALMPEGPTARESLPRLVSVLQVMTQELSARAAEHGTAAAVVADAELFAAQVEASVTQTPPAETAAPPAPVPVPATPADPDGRAAEMSPGSVFGWKPIEHSPDHGLPALDRLIRRALAETPSPYEKGFELAGAARRDAAQVFFYGEKHTDGGLIAANMRRLSEDARPGKPVVVLVEGYTGWELRGYKALEYLAKRGLDADALTAKQPSLVAVRGWDAAERYDASKHPLLAHHMDQLELNRLAFGESRGLPYYAAMARGAWRAAQSRRELWRKAIVARNADLDAAVRRAAEDAWASGGTVHVIAGTDHLMESPRLDGVLGAATRPRLRRSLAAAAGGAYWASQPANTPRPLRLVIMGPPASGKGTYAQRLARDYGVVHISAGELLREHAKTHPDIAAIMKRGDLVPAALVVGLVRERLRRPDVAARGFLLDGFPRRLEEAHALREMMVEEGIALDAAIKLDVPERELLRRVLARGRADDTEPTFRNRMKVYHDVTEPAMREISRGATVLAPRWRPGQDADAAYAAMRRLMDARTAPSLWRRLLGRLARLLGA